MLPALKRDEVFLMVEAMARANGIEICYETFGDESNEPLLLVMGLGAQMTLWDEAFCQTLADQGFHVIRYDNRDVGLSSKIEGGPAPRSSAWPPCAPASRYSTALASRRPTSSAPPWVA